MKNLKTFIVVSISTAVLPCFLAGCNPTVKVQSPDKPITINLNVKHNVHVKVEKDVDKLFTKDKGLF